MSTTTPRYSLYDKDGYYLTDIRTSAITSWTLPARGVVGECSFNLSRYEPKNRKYFMGFGRYLLRRQLNMPDWIGILYTPRRWPYGMTEFKAFQAEKVLAWRVTPSLKITGQAGDLFDQILQITNNPSEVTNEKPIYQNSIWKAGIDRDETLGSDALSHIWRIAERSQNDFSVGYSIDAGGRLYLTGNWYSRAGIDTGRTFREGHNIEVSPSALEETGELWNDYTAVNDASTPATRLISRQWNDAAIAENGLYQKTIAYSGLRTQATLDSNVIYELKKTVDASRILDLNALLGVGDTAQYVDVGNTWDVDYNSAGYDGNGYGTHETVKILGIEVDDANIQKARLITEVVL